VVKNTQRVKQGKPKVEVPNVLKLKPTREKSTGEELYTVVIHTDHPEKVRAAGVHVNSEFSKFVTARISVSDIQTLVRIDEVERVQGSPTPHEEASAASGLSSSKMLNKGLVNNTEYTGEGVITCVVDILDDGIDWTHKDFRGIEDTTESRILRIWDQSLNSDAVGGKSPAGYNYGVEYTRTDIENELDGNSDGFVQTEYSGVHDTHVTGIIAGNGGSLPTRKYEGIAPESDIVFVKSEDSYLDGLSYCGDVAESENKPVVANLSFSSYSYTPRDGSDFVAQAANDFAGPGRVVVTSAGNIGGGSILHGNGSIEGKGKVKYEVEMTESSRSNTLTEFWFEDASGITVTVTSPNGEKATRGHERRTPKWDTLGTDGRVQLRNGGDNGEKWFTGVLIGGYVGEDTVDVATGTWTVTLNNSSGSTVTYDGWQTGCRGRAKPPDSWGTDMTVTSPGTAEDAIAVGAYTHRRTWTDQQGFSQGGWIDTDRMGDIAPFSSRGPTRDGRTKPDVVAPGTNVASTLSSDAQPSSYRVLPGGKHLVQSGTSMSSPVVAGVVALLFQENPNLTPDQVETLLEGPARNNTLTGVVPNNTWGGGKVNALGSVVQAVNSSGQSARELLAYDDGESTDFEQITSGEKVAVRFTPSVSGKVTGIRIRPSKTVSIKDSVTIEVWKDNGSGLPEKKIGSTAKYAGDHLLPYSWNHLDLSTIDAQVINGTDYHVVIGIPGSGDEMSIAVEEGSPDGRSSIKQGSNWKAQNDQDYRIRTLVSRTTGVSGELPVELANFEASETGSGVQLTWKTASETDNAGFEVQRRTEQQSAWKQVGDVKPKTSGGSTTETKSYRYSDTELPYNADRLEYRLRQVDTDGSAHLSKVVTVQRGTSELKLLAPSPNPARGQVTFQYAVPEKRAVTIQLYDVLGRQVKTLLRRKQEGRHEQVLDTSVLPSGTYFLRLQTGEQIRIHSLTVVR
jgi:subtilisin family serine protease